MFITIKNSHYQLVFILQLILSLLVIKMGYAAENIQTIKDQAKHYYWGAGVKQNYSKALELYLKASNLGDTESKFIAGGMYYHGMGVDKDINQAINLLYRAAIKGESVAQSERIIAEAYIQGVGKPKNYENAIQWYQQAANNGDSEAQNTLGYLYFIGEIVEQDFTKGTSYFLLAAHNGSAIAQYNVGVTYYTGQGIEIIDHIKSYAWMNVAASNGYHTAIGARDYLETLLSREELNEAQRLSLELGALVGK